MQEGGGRRGDEERGEEDEVTIEAEGGWGTDGQEEGGNSVDGSGGFGWWAGDADVRKEKEETSNKCNREKKGQDLRSTAIIW